jgi:hypothetical protein
VAFIPVLFFRDNLIDLESSIDLRDEEETAQDTHGPGEQGKT